MADDNQFQNSIEALSTAIEERPPIPVEEVPPPPSKARLYWMIGAFCALTVGTAEVGVLFWSDPPADAPPADVLVMFENDPCGRRMAAIMDAVAAYDDVHGTPPPTLSALVPDQLSAPPIDPASGLPYGYEVIGESVSITCPSADSQAPGQPPAPPQAPGA